MTAHIKTDNAFYAHFSMTLLSMGVRSRGPWEYYNEMPQPSPRRLKLSMNLHSVGTSHGCIHKAHMNKHTLPNSVMSSSECIREFKKGWWVYVLTAYSFMIQHPHHHRHRLSFYLSSPSSFRSSTLINWMHDVKMLCFPRGSPCHFVSKFKKPAQPGPYWLTDFARWSCGV